MTAIFKNLWLDRYPLSDQRFWARELADKTDHQIKWGFVHLKEGPPETFPPNVLQFRSLCTISLRDLKLEWPGESYRRAVNGTGSDIEMKIFAVSGKDYEIFLPMFTEVTNQYLRYLRGQPHNPEITAALAPPQNHEVAAEQLRLMKEILS